MAVTRQCHLNFNFYSPQSTVELDWCWWRYHTTKQRSTRGSSRVSCIRSTRNAPPGSLSGHRCRYVECRDYLIHPFGWPLPLLWHQPSATVCQDSFRQLLCTRSCFSCCSLSYQLSTLLRPCATSVSRSSTTPSMVDAPSIATGAFTDTFSCWARSDCAETVLAHFVYLTRINLPYH